MDQLGGIGVAVRGYSLLEMLVVLALISLVSAVVFPGMIKLFESVSSNIEREGIVLQINALGRQSFDSKSALVLGVKNVTLPEGWKIVTPYPIRYSNLGVCSGGLLQLLKNNEVLLDEQLAPPYCQIPRDS